MVVKEETCHAPDRAKGPISFTPMVIDGGTNVNEVVEADSPKECTNECHSSASCGVLLQDEDELMASHLALEQQTATPLQPPSPTMTTTTTQMELGQPILDDDFYRKNNLCIPVNDLSSDTNNVKDGGGGGTMLLVSEVGLLEINPAGLDLFIKRIDRRRECACIVM